MTKLHLVGFLELIFFAGSEGGELNFCSFFYLSDVERLVSDLIKL
jgi:hypothetical protein